MRVFTAQHLRLVQQAASDRPDFAGAILDIRTQGFLLEPVERGHGEHGEESTQGQQQQAIEEQQPELDCPPFD